MPANFLSTYTGAFYASVILEYLLHLTSLKSLQIAILQQANLQHMLIRSVILIITALYSFSVTAQCTETPPGGTASSSAFTACAGDSILLTVANSLAGPNISFQWQQSADSSLWENLPAGNTDSLRILYNGQNFYRRMVICGDSTSVSSVVKITTTPLLQCYCKPVSNCTQNDFIRRVEIGTLNRTSGCSANGYIDYSLDPNVAVPSIHQESVTPIAVTVSSGGTEFVSVWIDYNRNGTFDTDEYTFIGTGNGSAISGAINIPSTALTGITKMRVRMKFNALPASTEACNGFAYGETEDYLINILPAPPCTGMPQGGTARADRTLVCEVDSITLTVTGATGGFTGLTYLWQSSQDSLYWADIPEDSLYFATVMQTNSTYYRRITACGTNLAYSEPVKVLSKESRLCYCRPSSSLCNSTATITKVRFSNLNNSSNCSLYGYGDYAHVTPAIIRNGDSVSIFINTTSINTTLINYFAAWIDFNQNGIFEGTEFANLGSIQGNGTASASIAVPADAAAGITGMRIRSRNGGALLAQNACTNFPISETEDYYVQVGPDCIVNTWTGRAGDNNWETDGNWSCGQVPGENTIVVIQDGNVQVNSAVVIRSLMLNPQANLTVNPSFSITVRE